MTPSLLAKEEVKRSLQDKSRYGEEPKNSLLLDLTSQPTHYFYKLRMGRPPPSSYLLSFCWYSEIPDY